MSNATRFTCQQIAAKWLAPKTRKAAEAYAAERAKTSARKRWANLHAAMAAGDDLRVRAYAAESGEARKSAWERVRTAAAPPPKAAAPTRKARATAKAVAGAVREATGSDPLAEAARLLGIDPDALAAFAQLVAKAPASRARACPRLIPSQQSPDRFGAVGAHLVSIDGRHRAERAAGRLMPMQSEDHTCRPTTTSS
jgi:hypothetical protein